LFVLLYLSEMAILLDHTCKIVLSASANGCENLLKYESINVFYSINVISRQMQAPSTSKGHYSMW